MITPALAKAALLRAIERQNDAVDKLAHAGSGPIDVRDTFAMSEAARALSHAEAALEDAEWTVRNLGALSEKEAP